MINRYSDHAANERTFLAWIRTAIAVMAFGFLVEKFDLFLEVAARSLAGRAPPATGQLVGNFAGLLLIVLGGAIMVTATLRYRQVAKDIDAPEPRSSRDTRQEVVLALLLLGLGSTLFAYLLYTIVRSMS
jgi:putative membrane protein